MSVVPKAEPEAVGEATTSPPFSFEPVSDQERQWVDRPQNLPVVEPVSPNKASTPFVVAWIIAIAAVAGFIVWAAVSNP
jgi:hypothetical protein